MHSPLAIHDVKKAFGKRTVLDGVELEVKAGEIFGLVGLNGIGKTTLIKIILDLINADNGHAEIFGVSAKDPAARKKLAYLPEKFSPSRHLKGKEFLDLTLSYFGKKLDLAYAQAFAERLHLDPKALDQMVRRYSKGMGQKLGLLGTLMLEAPLLILDEPMSGLDPMARVDLKKELLDYRRRGHAVFFSSHILSDMEEICDRIAILHNQHILFCGAPSELPSKYGENLERAFLKVIEADSPAAMTAA